MPQTWHPSCRLSDQPTQPEFVTKEGLAVIDTGGKFATGVVDTGDAP